LSAQPAQLLSFLQVNKPNADSSRIDGGVVHSQQASREPSSGKTWHYDETGGLILPPSRHVFTQNVNIKILYETFKYIFKQLKGQRPKPGIFCPFHAFDQKATRATQICGKAGAKRDDLPTLPKTRRILAGSGLTVYIWAAVCILGRTHVRLYLSHTLPYHTPSPR
jgi:hypothetical protein